MGLGIVLGVVCIVAANAAAPRIRVAAPLLLVVVGVLVSVQPVVDVGRIEIEPEVVLGGVLPLLLFAAAVSMPAVSFRRNFGVIAGLSVTLVVITSLALGALFAAVLPGLGFAGGVALGAVISPTDAVATSIVKRLGVAPRVVAVLDGEAMLNDASALVMLRTALAAVAATGGGVGAAVGKFALSIVIATAIGGAVGFATLLVRRRIRQATVNTLLSFAVPLIAFQPAEHAGASGLVAVVAAGLVIGQGAPRYLEPAHRANERINWHTVEMLLEGGLFLVMGLQLVTLLDESRAQLPLALGLAGAALGIALLARAVYVVPLLWSVRHQQTRYEAARGNLEALRDGLVQTEGARSALADHENAAVARVQSRVRRLLADADYSASRPLGLRDAVLLVWAGMRGAITLAAAQTLPPEFPHRSLLVLVAFIVATGSLLLQGGTLGWVVRRLRFPAPDERAAARERDELTAELERAGLAVLDAPATAAAHDPGLIARMRERLAASHDGERVERAGALIDEVFDAQRARILAARRDGVYSTEALADALARVDAMQLGVGITRRGSLGDE
ncbi:MAG: cation:proton antiporter [Deltaproteobacteria bacterium]|nr:cation:proton antiporter [Deltaproteobacteria bacterium]